MIAPSTKHSMQLAREHLEKAVEALPRLPQTMNLALMIEEAIEISYEVELTSPPPEGRGDVVDLLHRLEAGAGRSGVSETTQ